LVEHGISELFVVRFDNFFRHKFEEVEEQESVTIKKPHHEPGLAHQICEEVETRLEACSTDK